MYPHPIEIYLRPRSVAEVVAALRDYGSTAKIIAGGHSLMSELKSRICTPRALIDINRVAELAHLDIDGSGLRCGALIRFNTIAEHPGINSTWPALAEAAGTIGDRQVRNRGTLLGSLVQAAHWGDIAPAAAVLGAAVEIVGPNGTRMVPVEAFIVGAMRTTLTADELAVALHVPRQNSASVYLKHGRVAQDRATLSVAVALHSVEHHCLSVSVAIGGLSGHPITRATAVESLLVDKALSDDLLNDAGTCAAATLAPQSDELASADYRRQLLRVLIPRALALAIERNQGKQA